MTIPQKNNIKHKEQSDFNIGISSINYRDEISYQKMLEIKKIIVEEPYNKQLLSKMHLNLFAELCCLSISTGGSKRREALYMLDNYIEIAKVLSISDTDIAKKISFLYKKNPALVTTFWSITLPIIAKYDYFYIGNKILENGNYYLFWDKLCNYYKITPAKGRDNIYFKDGYIKYINSMLKIIAKNNNFFIAYDIFHEAIHFCIENNLDAKKITSPFCYWNSMQQKQAIEEFTKDADDGNENAIIYVADCYYNGVGIQRDHHIAFNYYLQAAKKNNPYAQYKVAQAYYYGEGCRQNTAAAIAWLQKGISQNQNNESDMEYMLAVIYMEKKEIIFQKRAVKILLKLSESGYQQAILDLAICYYQGKIIEKNDLKAEELAKKLIAENDDEYVKNTAQALLCALYIKNKIFNKDVVQNRKILEELAKKGNDFAKTALKLLNDGRFKK